MIVYSILINVSTKTTMASMRKMKMLLFVGGGDDDNDDGDVIIDIRIAISILISYYTIIIYTLSSPPVV